MKYLLLTLLCSASMAHSMEKRHSIEEMRQVSIRFELRAQAMSRPPESQEKMRLSLMLSRDIMNEKKEVQSRIDDSYFTVTPKTAASTSSEEEIPTRSRSVTIRPTPILEVTTRRPRSAPPAIHHSRSRYLSPESLESISEEDVMPQDSSEISRLFS